jgi:hypothetical protein
MDRKIRSFVIAPLLVILAIVFHGIVPLMVVLLVLAVVMLATSAVRTCPLYMRFTFSTAKKFYGEAWRLTPRSSRKLSLVSIVMPCR